MFFFKTSETFDFIVVRFQAPEMFDFIVFNVALSFLERNCNYSLRGNNFLNRWRVNSVRYGTESVSFLAPKIWDILPKEIKNSETLNAFSAKFKNWVPQECPCRLSKKYVLKVGFISKTITR